MSISPTLPPDEVTLKAYYESGAWQMQTIYDIVAAHSAARPDATAITSSYRTYSWCELVALIDGFAMDLVRHGLRAGDTIFVGAPNRIETVIALLAASRDGFVCCPSPHRNHTIADIVDMCRRASCAIYVHQPGHGADADGDEILPLIRDLASIRHIYELPADAAGAPFGGNTGLAGAMAPPAGNPDLITYLAFTSGSTGKPKGVMHSDNTQLVAARGIAWAWDLGADTVTLSLSPFSHNLGCGTLWSSLVAGGEFVLHDWPRSESLLDRIDAAGVNYLVGVPTHAMDLLAEIKERGLSHYNTLKSFRVSAAACPEHVAADLYDIDIPVQKGYGMTETNGHQLGLPGDTRDRVMHTSGVCCPGYELAVYDTNDPDRRLPAGETGLVAGRGASLMLGYFQDAAAAEACLNADKWFLTGDLGTLDEDGYLSLTGRKKELIVRGGHNINPNVIEDYALRHEAIDLAAAIPVPDDRLGERACLAVMFAAGQSVSAAALLDHLLAGGLSRYDLPEFWLPQADIPLMPNGKMDKLEILGRVRDGSLVPEPV